MSILQELIGQTLDDKYRIEKQLGQGGMGAVYLATHLGTGRPVALKVITPQFMANEEFVERFKREAQAAGLLRHPNVVNVTDFGFTRVAADRIAYLVMEYLNGCNLGDLLKERGPLPVNFVIEIVEQICLAVGEAHKQGIIHRDLKPDNIWLEPNGRGGYNIKVLDFGLAKLYSPSSADAPVAAGLSSRPALPTMPAGHQTMPNSEASLSVATAVQLPLSGVAGDNTATQVQVSSEDKTQVAQQETQRHSAKATVPDAKLTQVGAILGTPLYMSPEQCCGAQLTTHSDIYSLGVIIYEMLTGVTPFTGNFYKLLNAHCNEAPPRLRARLPKISEPLERLIMSALSKDPAARPKSTAAFIAALRAANNTENEVLREAKLIAMSLLANIYLFSALIYIPFIVLSVLVKLALTPLAASHALLMRVLLWSFVFLGMLVASRLNAAIFMTTLHQMIVAPPQPIRSGVIIKRFWQRLGRVLKALAYSYLMTLAGLVRFVKPGINNYIEHALVVPVIVVEDLPAPAAFSRSKELVQHLRRVAGIFQLRDICQGVASLLFGFISMMSGLAFVGISLNDTVKRLGFLETFAIVMGWYFVGMINAMYNALPLGVLYFRARQMNGEMLDQELPTNLANKDQKNSDGGWSKSTKIWVSLPIVTIAVFITLVTILWLRNVETSLHEAVTKGSRAEVKRLLAAGVNVNNRDLRKRTPLMLAARDGYTDIVKMLVAAGAELNARDEDNDSALFEASYIGSAEIVKTLLSAGCEVNAVNKNSETALIAAARRGRAEVVKALLAAQPDLNIKDKEGKTALAHAQEQEFTDIVAMLQAAGAK